MIINNEHKLCRAVYRLLKSEISYNYVHCTQLRLTMLAYHIIHAPPEARSRYLPVPRRLLYHWAMDPLLPVIFRQILFSVEVLKCFCQSGPGQRSWFSNRPKKHTRGRGPWFLDSHRFSFSGFGGELPRKSKYESSRRKEDRRITRVHNSAIEPSAQVH